MKLALATPTPEIKVPVPVALLSGPFRERLQKAARLGYDGVELMAARPDELDAADIGAQVSEMGLEVAAVASGAVYMVDGLTLLAEDAGVSRRAVERLGSLIEFASALQAPLVTIGGFRGRLAWAGGPHARARLVEILRAAAEEAAEHGVRLVLEPLNRYESDILNNAGEGLALIEEVGHTHLGLLLDTFHVNIEEPSVYDCFRQVMAAGRLWHVHVGDNNRLPPGQGHLDFAGMVATLREIGYQGYLSAELLPRPDPDSAAEATIKHMQQFVPAANWVVVPESLMSDKRLVLIHTVSPLLEVFDKLGAELLPGVELMHILDEPLLEMARRPDHQASEVSARLQTHVAMAERVGARAALVTCSTVSPNVDGVRPEAGIPVLKIDEAMIAQAVETGARIGVVATAASTLEPTRQLLQARADEAGKQVEIELVLVEDAFSALMSGDGATHDRLVKQAALELALRVDVVVLAQASMARVLDVIPEAERPVPILSSPHLALEQIRSLIVSVQGAGT